MSDEVEEYDGTQVENPVEANEEEVVEDVQESLLEGDKPDSESEPKDRPPRRNRKTFDQRIKELTWHWREAEERAQAAQLAYDQARAENERLRSTTEARQGAAADPDEEINRLLEERKKATAEEDFNAINEVNDRLHEARMRKLVREQQQRYQQPEPQRAQPEIHPSAQAWLQRNPWYNEPQNAHLAASVLALHNRLVAVDHYPVGDELYQELDRRLRDLPDFDGVLYQRRNGAQEARTTPARSVVAGPSRGGVTRSVDQKTRLTDYDLDVMRRSKLDPANKKHVDTYLKYRVG